MDCKRKSFNDHAVIQMFKRDISVEDVDKVINTGEIIKKYSSDKPYPTYLVLSYIGPYMYWWQKIQQIIIA